MTLAERATTDLAKTPLPARHLALAGYAALFGSGFADNARGPIIPSIIETFQVSDARASLLLGLGCIAGLPGGLAAGALIERIGVRATLRLSAAVVAIGLALVGVAGLLGREAFLLVPVAGAVLGAGLSALGVVANVFVALASTPGERGRALARLHVLYAAASLLVPLFIAQATNLAAWPLVVIAAALVPGSLTPLASLVPHVAPLGPPRPKEGPAPSSDRTSRATILRYTLVVSLFVVGEVAVSGWLTLYAKRTTTWEPTARASLLSGFFVGMGLARAAGGIFLREDRLRRAIVVGALASAVAVLAGLHVHPAFLSLEGATVGILFPATVAALTLELPEELHGKAMGVVTGGYSAALALAHTLIGHLSDTIDIRAALHLSPICLVLGVLVFVLGGKRRAVG